MVEESVIKYWVNVVNQELGKESLNYISEVFFREISRLPCADFIYTDDWYLVSVHSPNMWGEEELHIISCYVKPEKRNGISFLQIQHKIQELEKKYKVRYTIQGSHIDDKYYKFLSGIGYKVCSMQKEIKNG